MLTSMIRIAKQHGSRAVLLFLLACTASTTMGLQHLDDDSIDFVGCFQDLVASDSNSDGSLRMQEYETFLQLYSVRACQNTTTLELSLDQRAAFETLSCTCRVIPGNLPTCCLGQAAQIDIRGAASYSETANSNEHYPFLRAICKVVDATFPEPKCRAPTVSPSTISPPSPNAAATLPPVTSTAAPSSMDGTSDGSTPVTLTPSRPSSASDLPSPTLIPSPSSQPVASPTTSSSLPSTTSSSIPVATTRINYELCYIDMLMADMDFDNVISADEYGGFANAYAKRVYCFERVSTNPAKSVLSMDAVSAAFETIACLCQTLANGTADCCEATNAHIDTTAIIIADRSMEDTLYLEAACLLTDELVRDYADCDGGNGSVPASKAPVAPPLSMGSSKSVPPVISRAPSIEPKSTSKTPTSKQVASKAPASKTSAPKTATTSKTAAPQMATTSKTAAPKQSPSGNGTSVVEETTNFLVESSSIFPKQNKSLWVVSCVALLLWLGTSHY